VWLFIKIVNARLSIKEVYKKDTKTEKSKKKREKHPQNPKKKETQTPQQELAHKT